MYKDTPRTDWHVPMCIGVESGYLPFIIFFWLLIFILLYCSVYLSICIIHIYNNIFRALYKGLGFIQSECFV